MLAISEHIATSRVALLVMVGLIGGDGLSVVMRLERRTLPALVLESTGGRQCLERLTTLR
jgi:hypothetical protein